ADETDAVDGPRKRRARGADDADGFGTDHGDRGRQAGVAADRLPPARQHEMAALDGRLDDIGRTDEFGHETVFRLEIHLARRNDLGDTTLLHHDDAVAELH